MTSGFVTGTAPVYLSGANCYYLAYKSPAVVDALLDSTVLLGLNVIRTWAFLDRPQDGVVFQSWDDATQCMQYHDGLDGLCYLDYVIYAAGQRGLRLILPLVNNWTDFGGMDQYLRWFGLCDHAQFYLNAQVRAAYRDWALHLLTRKNTLTGVEYRNDPTIFAWELTNEARCEAGADVLTRWASEMASHLKTIDGNHLVAMGDEGFFNRPGHRDWFYNGSAGVDWEALLNIPELDFGTFHLYPKAWGMPLPNAVAWIEDHLEAGRRAGKPVILGEYGWRDRASRNEVYGQWLGAMRAGGGAGDMFWMLAAGQEDGSLYPDYDGYTMYLDTVPPTVLDHLASLRAS